MAKVSALCQKCERGDPEGCNRRLHCRCDACGHDHDMACTGQIVDCIPTMHAKDQG